MRRFVFLLLCCLLFCLPALGEAFEVVPSETEPGVYYMRAEFAGYPQYELGQPWVRRDGKTDAPLPQTLHEFLRDMCPAGENMAYVDNAYPSQRLNLRVRPDQASTTLGKYYSGTPVEILDYPNEVWAHVRVGSREGYMKRLYLTPCNPPADELVVQFVPGETIALFAQPRGDAQVLGRYNRNTPVTVLGEPVDGWWDGDQIMPWYPVRIGTREGYMLVRDVKPGAYAVAAPPIVTIRNTSGTGLNLRAAPESKGKIIRLIENGERVTVLGITENYLHVRAGADTGFIQNRSTVPALDYHSSETKPAFEPFEAVVNKDKCYSQLSPRLFEGYELRKVVHYPDFSNRVTICGIYGIFAQLENNPFVLTEDITPLN